MWPYVLGGFFAGVVVILIFHFASPISYVLGGFFAGVVVGIFSIYRIAIFARKIGFLDDDDDKE